MIKTTGRISHQIKLIPTQIKTAEFPLTKIDLSRFEGIQSDIPLFNSKSNISLNDIVFITKHLETLNLFRGCRVNCSHCLKNAKPAQKGSETILFEDLERFLDGFKTLSERFGFNVLNGTKYLSIVDDSNPSDIPIKGLAGQHSVVEAMGLIYQKLQIPPLFVTSGWNQKSKYAQNNAENLVKMVKTNPDSIKDVEISINPFTGLMEKSREALESKNQATAEFFRNIYTSRMANVLATFIDLFKLEKATIIYRHANNSKNEGINELETRKLYEEIYNKLHKIIGSKVESLPQLKPENLTKFDKKHLIEPSGRARKFFSKEENFKEQSQLIAEALDWELLTSKEKKEKLQDFAVKGIDINGQVYATMPANKVDFVNTPIELTVPTNIQLNYINNIETAPIYSDIELELI